MIPMLRSTSALIGRGEQLAELARLLHEHPIVCVVGPLGIGKTALAIELLAREHRAGHLPPFARLSIAGATDERALLERTARALGREPPSSAPARIAATLRRMLAASPHAIFWDDAQQANLDAVSSLVRALELPAGGSRLLLASRAPLAGLELPSLELPPLGAAEARRLLHRLERERDLSLSETLVRRAAGNPLVLRLAAATLQDPAALEPEAVVRQAIAMLCREGAQPILALLSSLEGSISAIELKRLFPSARPIVDRLIDYGLLIVSGGEVEVPPALATLIRERLGALAAESWEVLRASADRALSAAPTDPDSLLLACRALTVRGEAAQALALLERHSLARHGISSQALEQLLRSLAATSPERAGHARLILASEQLRRGDVGAALRSLEDLDPGAAEGELAARIEVIRARALARAGGLHTARGKLERSVDRPPAAASDLSAQITVAAVAGSNRPTSGTCSSATARSPCRSPIFSRSASIARSPGPGARGDIKVTPARAARWWARSRCWRCSGSTPSIARSPSSTPRAKISSSPSPRSRPISPVFIARRCSAGAAISRVASRRRSRPWTSWRDAATSPAARCWPTTWRARRSGSAASSAPRRSSAPRAASRRKEDSPRCCRWSVATRRSWLKPRAITARRKRASARPPQVVPARR